MDTRRKFKCCLCGFEYYEKSAYAVKCKSLCEGCKKETYKSSQYTQADDKGFLSVYETAIQRAAAKKLLKISKSEYHEWLKVNFSSNVKKVWDLAFLSTGHNVDQFLFGINIFENVERTLITTACVTGYYHHLNENYILKALREHFENKAWKLR